MACITWPCQEYNLNDTVMFLAMIRYLLSGERQQTNRYKEKRVATEISPIANFHFYVHGNVLNTFSITKPIADSREHLDYLTKEKLNSCHWDIGIFNRTKNDDKQRSTSS